MLSGRFTQTLLYGLDRVISRISAKDIQTPAINSPAGAERKMLISTCAGAATSLWRAISARRGIMERLT